MTHFLRKIVAAWFILGSMSVGFAQQMPPIPTDPNVRIGKLDNGLTYYIRHNELPEKRADFYIAQKVGSILEDENQRGLAHFLEHMCFNGTKNFPGKTLIKYLESIGVKFGTNLNAYTGVDETVYNISNVPMLRDGIADSCLLILHDWANALTLDSKEIDSERAVIHEEWRTTMRAMDRMNDIALPIVLQDSKYAHRMPIGTMEVVDNFPYQALHDYYEKWYRPDLQGIIIVGDIDVDKMEAKVKEVFSPIQMPENAAERTYATVPNNKEPIVAIEKDKEQQSTLIYYSYKHDAFPGEMKNNMEYLVINYMKSMLENMLNARLSELIQSPNPPFINAQVSEQDLLGYIKTKDAFTGIALCKEDDIATALGALLREINRARQFGFTASEYARAKAEYLTLLESAYNERNTNKNEDYVKEYVQHFLENEPIPGIENEYAIMSQIVPNIPVEAINQLFSSLATDSNQVATIYCPEKEGVVYPTTKEIQELIKKVGAEKLTPYEDNVSDEPLISETPQAGKIVKTEEGPFGTTILTLSNGVRVIIKPTDFKADEIYMQAFSPGGTSVFDDTENNILNSKVINDIADVGGLGKFSNVELEKMLAGKNVSIETFVRGLSEGMKGNSTPKDLETLMQLIYLSFTSPRMDEGAFESIKNRIKASLSNFEANPKTALKDTLNKAMYMDHPRIKRLKADMMDKIDYAQILEMYKDRFKDASDFTFLFVGNINTEEAKPLIETYLGGLPAINRKENFRDMHIDFRPGKYENIFNKAQETPKATVIITTHGKCDYSLKNDIMMSMLKQILDIVYVETIREKEGGTYGVGCYGYLSRYPKDDEAVLQISFDTDPPKRKHLTEMVLVELNKIAQEGPSAEDLNKVKEFMLKKHKENSKENSYWLNVLNEYFWYKADMNSNYDQIVNSITIADIQNFTKALLSQGNQIEVSMTTGDTN